MRAVSGTGPQVGTGGYLPRKMDHIAIMDKKRKFLEKILSGEKTIESRWYVTKRVPWDRIKAGETIYFKESGNPVAAKATVSEVMQFYLPQTNIAELLEKHGKAIGFKPEKFPETVEWCKKRKYCILVRLKEVQKITPFNIDKKGFGMMAAWITVEDISHLRLSCS